MTVAEMPTQRKSREHRTIRFRFTVDQYHRMIAEGILPEGEPYELLDGQVVRKDRSAQKEDPMTVGDHHSYVVMKLTRLNRQLERRGCHLRPQQPIAIPPRHEPEPDGAIVRGMVDDYRDHKPAPAEVLCAIEVADASLRQDRGLKQRVYADAGIETYVIFNLVDHVVEVYAEPMIGKGRYGRVQTLDPTQTLAFPTPTGKELTVPIRRLLP